ncbi:MAG: hypothetical protein ACFWTN_09740 [Clostridium sp.]
MQRKEGHRKNTAEKYPLYDSSDIIGKETAKSEALLTKKS